jgi:hypothetical protein
MQLSRDVPFIVMIAQCKVPRHLQRFGRVNGLEIGLEMLVVLVINTT